jgi:carbamoyl-phosphate synthase small subunit
MMSTVISNPASTRDAAEQGLKARVAARKSAVLVFPDGTVIKAQGLGATGISTGELCFNTALTGYQEILTDPSYAGQIITFTFPHIGNVGINDDDMEAGDTAVGGCILRAPVTDPSNYRSMEHLSSWLKARGIIGLAGVDTRALTLRIREHGLANVTIAHDAAGVFDVHDLAEQAASFPGLEGMDLAKTVSGKMNGAWQTGHWHLETGYKTGNNTGPHIVAVDFGVKRNMLRELSGLGARVTVVPATSKADDILALNPDGVLLSNGPGDPAATGEYAVPMIRALLEQNIPLLGICLGHQMLALALGARTKKMHQGHHGANHPVKDLSDGHVEITSMNHGFTVDETSLPDGVRQTHISLFDGSNCGLEIDGKPVISVQYHPEASPGPQDASPIFKTFLERIAQPAGRKAS